MDDKDEIWATEADHRTNGTKRSRAERVVVCCMELFCAIFRNKLYRRPKQRALPTNMREFLSWAQRHYRIDVTAPTAERKTGGMTYAGTCPGGCKEFSHKGLNAQSVRLTCNICGAVRKEERHPQRQDPAAMPPWTRGPQGKQRTHAKDGLC